MYKCTVWSVQEISDEDLAAGLGLLADRLRKPSTSNDTTNGNLEIPDKQSSMVIVTVPTNVKPLAAQSQFVASSVAANRVAEITDLSAADWSTLVSQLQAGSQPTVMVEQGPVSLAGTTISEVPPAPRVKKVIRLVAKRPSSSTVGQSQSCTGIVGLRPSSTCLYRPPKLNDVMIPSVADANSLTSLHPDFSSPELLIGQEYHQ